MIPKSCKRLAEVDFPIAVVLGLHIRIRTEGRQADALLTEIRQALADLHLADRLRLSMDTGTR
jgi:hypothetical protein